MLNEKEGDLLNGQIADYLDPGDLFNRLLRIYLYERNQEGRFFLYFGMEYNTLDDGWSLGVLV